MPAMPNPPITRIDFSTGAAVVYADKQKFTFPIKGVPSAPPVPALDVEAMTTRLEAAIAKIGIGSLGMETPPTPDMPPSNIVELADMTVTANVPTVLGAGVMLKPKHFDVQQSPLIIHGAGMRKTILDGQSGAGGGHRMAWGKAFIHPSGTTHVQDVGFKDCGGGDGKGDGEAGLYLEGFAQPGVAKALRCAFDGCENGIFSPNPPGGDNVDLLVESCVFGRLAANGSSGDGQTHDVYLSNKNVTIRKSVFVGNSIGNTIKSRSQTVLLEDNYIGRGNGRWLDFPCASNVTSRRNTYVSTSGAASGNAIGLFDEGDARFEGGGTFTFENDTFYFGRQNGEVIWLPDTRTIATFTSCKVFWIGKAGDRPAAVEVRGLGQVRGIDFSFTEANRVDAPPPVLGDPVG